MAPFVVFALPRSRTAWTRFFLAQNSREVSKELLLDSDTIEDFISPLASGQMAGTVETTGAIAWRIIHKELPWARLATIRRPLDEVLASISRIGLEDPETTQTMIWLDSMLDLIEKVPGTLRIEYADLATAAGGKALFQHCLGEPFPEEWFEHLNGIKIQVKIPEFLEKVRSRQNQTQELLIEIVTASRPLGLASNLQ